jgi:predicted GTPase
VKAVSRNTSNWLLARLVEGAGKHLINLYSGQVYDPADLRLSTDGHEGSVPGDVVAEANLKILLVGQVNAGKSSLINALFGELKSSPFHLPETRDLLSFSKELPGIGKVLLIDSPGFNEAEGGADPLKKIEGLLHSIDLIILVSPANSAARQLEADFVARLDERRRANAREIFPPLVVVLNKVDLLRPLQHWSPPYNITEIDANSGEEARRKAANIRDCVIEAARELKVEPPLVVPMTLKMPDRIYNTETLILTLGQVLPYARHTLLRRMLREYHDDRYWEDLANSFKQSGKIVLRSGLDAVFKGIKEISKRVDRLDRE